MKKFLIQPYHSRSVWLDRYCKDIPNQHYQEVYRNIRLTARYANSIIAGTAINGPIVFRQEWNLCLRSTFGAYNCMHLTGRTIRSSACATFRATAATAAGTTARLINQALLLVKLLFACGKCEIISTVAAFEGLVYETQNQGPPCDVMVFSQVHILAESPAVSPLAARD
jgi:hypothetical protein